jgi:5-(carboxyamino)imidazole ribonucleotide mutase
MGSQSDWDTMQHAADQLDALGVPYEVGVVSAHRTPELLFEYSGAAEGRGLQVLIAGAGGAAHLPGMLASLTSVPVIGVPVPLQHLDGLDSLLSIVQMPGGVPVATVGVGNAKNGALLAARIIASGGSEDDLRVRSALDDLREESAHKAMASGDALRKRRSQPTGFGI